MNRFDTFFSFYSNIKKNEKNIKNHKHVNGEMSSRPPPLTLIGIWQVDGT